MALASLIRLIILSFSGFMCQTAAQQAVSYAPLCNDAQIATFRLNLLDGACLFDASSPGCTAGLIAIPLGVGDPNSSWIAAPVPNATYGNITFAFVELQPSLSDSLANYVPSAAAVCPAGFFCPEALPCAIPCAQGYLCVPAAPDPSNNRCVPYNLPPMHISPGGQASCAYGAPLPLRCPEGMYCPTPATTFACQEGYFCMGGNVTPHPCPWLSLCPAGSNDIQMALLGVVCLGIVFLFAAMLLAGFFRCRDRLRHQRHRSRSTSWTLSATKSLETMMDGVLAHLPDEIAVDTVDQPSSTPVATKNPLSRTKSSRSSTKLAKKGYQVHLQAVSLRLKRGLCLSSPGPLILDGVSGDFSSGRVTAIMGASGSGKTSLVAAILGRAPYAQQYGKIMINGQAASLKSYQRVVGFVPQDDIMLPELTVKETLLFQALLRGEPNTPIKRVHKLVDSVLELLGLYDHRHSQIGDPEKRGISGGQRKRVNIGMELATDPSILLLDEPTSGLDSSTSGTIMHVLKMLAHELNVNVMVVLHQPRWEIFSAFDDVVLLAPGSPESPGGKVVYWGPQTRVLSYFNSLGYDVKAANNPADALIDTLADDRRSKALVQAWEHAKPAAAPLITPERYVPRRAPSLVQQGLLFAKRSCIQQVRSARHMALDAALLCFAALLVGLMYRGFMRIHVYTILNIAVMSLSMNAMQMGLRCFGTEKAVFAREIASGINPISYFVGKDVAEFPKQMMVPFIYLAMFYTLLHPLASVLTTYFVVLATVFAAWGWGYVVSALLPPQVSQVGAIVLALCWTTLSGVTPTAAELRTNLGVFGTIANTISFARWAVQGWLRAELETWPPGWQETGRLQLRIFEFTTYDSSDCIAIMFTIGLFARLLAFCIMMQKTRVKL